MDCPICAKAYSDENLKHTLECGHHFHSNCIISWFRTGANTCPLCRATPGDNNLDYFDIRTRSTYLRRAATRKNAPKELKQIVLKLKKWEQKKKENLAQLKQYKDKFKTEIKEARKIRNGIWRARSRISEIRRALGLFNSPEFPVPIVAPYHNRRRRRNII